MNNLINFFINYWLWFAFVLSIFWGTRSCILYATDEVVNLKDEGKKKYFLRSKHPKLANFFMGAYQFIFHFMGSFAGWCCFYVLLIRIQRNIDTFSGFNSGDILLFFLAVLGLVGHLSMVIYGIGNSFENLINTLTKKIS